MANGTADAVSTERSPGAKITTMTVHLPLCVVVDVDAAIDKVNCLSVLVASSVGI